MSDMPGATHKDSSPSQQSRPTIGMLIDSPTHIPGQMWLGAAAMARTRNVNLICFAGEALNDPDGFAAQANILYDLVTIDKLDGLIIVADGIGAFIGQQALEEFCQRYVPLPIVSIGNPIPGYPCLTTGDYESMHQAVAHLIEVHNYRRLAFVRGPEGHAGGERRYQAYLDTLKEYGLPYDPQLVSPPVRNWWGLEIPGEIIELFFDQRHAEIDAIVAVCDEIGLGVITVLQARGMRVPQDIAIIGYDDLPKSRAITPSLTTLRPSFFELGRQALTSLLGLMTGEPVAETIRVPAKLIVRQSCGCMNPTIAHAIAGPLEKTDESSPNALTARREQIIAEMVQVLENEGAQGGSAWAEQLFDALLEELSASVPGTFLSTLESVLSEVIMMSSDEQIPCTHAADLCVTVWQDILSILRRYTLCFLHDARDIIKIEDLWHQGRVLIGEVAIQTQLSRTIQEMEQARTLREVVARLTTSLNVQELVDVLLEELPRLGIPGCALSLYESPQQYECPPSVPEWSRLILAYTEQGRIDEQTDDHRYPSCRLAPKEFFDRDSAYHLIVEPLYFRQEQLGFAVFDSGYSHREMYDVLREEISAALHSALLVQLFQERTIELAHANAELTRQKYILDTFMENVPDAIYFKDRESRIIQANKAHAASVGLKDPSKELGKTDFDFFPGDKARLKYGQEQDIIRTGQPLLALQEPAAGGRWVLTTKMPLRDEHGEIIGTFGISHDITALKQMQAALERAYAEVEQQVEQRTAELQQEVLERQRAEEEIRQLENYLKNIIDSMPSALVGMDTEGKITQWNREAERLTGVLAQEAQGRLLPDVFPQLAGEMKSIRQAIRERRIQKAVKIPYEREGERQYADITVYPLVSNGVEGTVIRVDDVTERIRIEEMMIQTEKMMTIGGLAAGMAHEINNPLGIILQGIQNTRRRLEPKHSKNQDIARELGIDLERLHIYLERQHILQYWDGIQEAGLRASKIVTDMLNFSRPDQSTMAAVNLNQVIDTAIQLASSDYDLKKKYDFRGIQIRREYDPALTHVSCLVNEIEQVVLNLLRNAAQSLAEKQEANPQIRIRTRKEAKYARIVIEDNGIGIAEAEQKRLFEPFYTTKQVGIGNGLGLSISYFIVVTHHHGKIFVESTPGNGATFTLLLPL